MTIYEHKDGKGATITLNSYELKALCDVLYGMLRNDISNTTIHFETYDIIVVRQDG
jgi:hypothetical protein